MAQAAAGATNPRIGSVSISAASQSPTTKASRVVRAS